MNIRRSFGTKQSQPVSIIFYKQVKKHAEKQMSVGFMGK